jgi:hypothetical protein
VRDPVSIQTLTAFFRETSWKLLVFVVKLVLWPVVFVTCAVIDALEDM